MFKTLWSDRARTIALCVVVASGTAASSTSARAGFLDELFGSAPMPSQAYPDAAPSQPDTLAPSAPVKHRPPRDVAPVRQKTTDLMLDKTLRPGDAVMMRDGVHVYDGSETSHHSARQFVPVDAARSVSSKTRAALLAMDTMRNDPLRSGVAPDTLASGRSASVAMPISKGFKITDARGASIRYVGP
jgi:hypothetical protein